MIVETHHHRQIRYFWKLVVHVAAEGNSCQQQDEGQLEAVLWQGEVHSEGREGHRVYEELKWKC